MFRIRSAGWLVALALAPLAAGCGQISQGKTAFHDSNPLPPDTLTERTAEIGTYGGRFIIGQTSSPKTFNALMANESSSNDVTQRLFAGMADYDNATQQDIPGIAKVENEIIVLPVSNFDDRIRAQVYNRIYTQPSLAKYNANQGSLARALGPGGRSVALMAGGITNSPPIGYHAIHIVVNNGHVTLYGVVLNQSDATIAYIQANGTPGVFSVDNDLIVQGAPRKAAK